MLMRALFWFMIRLWGILICREVYYVHTTSEEYLGLLIFRSHDFSIVVFLDGQIRAS